MTQQPPGADHRVPGRRQPHRAGGRSGPARARGRSRGRRRRRRLRRAGRRRRRDRPRRSWSPTSACRPNFQDEGIEAAKEVRKRHPGTGVVILSQYDEPEYAISLLAEGAAGYAYLLKDRVERRQPLARAIREVATGGSMLDPEIVRVAGARRCATDGELIRAGGAAAPDGGGGPAGEGHRRSAARRRPRRSTTPSRRCSSAGQGGERRAATGALAPSAAAAEGHPRPRGAGRDAEPPAARRPGREAARRQRRRSTAPTG